ncbi:hypothetical protein BKA62DRAFT_91133 [Auriculariales sp. MPI-PUGE-AT-0066]|nr:hypothetical protein BKA62DRAFT_91133 [Auriculariales sp. MPI-PUGE-AT-0066]
MIDSFIQGRIQISKELSQRVQTQSNEDTTQPIRVVNKAVVDMGSGIESDVALARHIGDQVARANADLVLATRIVDGHKNHATGGMHLKNHASFPLDFFQREAEDLKTSFSGARPRWSKSNANSPRAVEPLVHSKQPLHTLSRRNMKRS